MLGIARRPNFIVRRRPGMGWLGALGGVLDPATIATYAQNAGFSGQDLYTAVAIALAESFPSGNPNSYNPETQAGAPVGKGSYGLWQIYLNQHPEFAGWNLYDPQANANAAYSIYAARGNSFAPWATFGSGKYQQYLPTVMASIAQPAAPASSLPLPPTPPADASALTIDASTGVPIPSSVDASQLAPAAASPSNTSLLYGAAAIAALMLIGVANAD